MQPGKLIIFSAPSGSGKSTIINYLLTQNLNLAFSISATSRAPRGEEKNGVEYYFLTPDEFLCREKCYFRRRCRRRCQYQTVLWGTGIVNIYPTAWNRRTSPTADKSRH